MWIFVRNIDPDTTRRELCRFLRTGLKPAWSFFPFSGCGQVRHCEVIRITDRDKGTEEFHGLALIDNAANALSAIRQLDNGSVNGRQVEVRKYYRRSAYRERRGTSAVTPRNENPLVHRNERRRPNLAVDLPNTGDAGEVELFLQRLDCPLPSP